MCLLDYYNKALFLKETGAAEKQAFTTTPTSCNEKKPFQYSTATTSFF
jgi:hypothetical protein